MHLEPAEVDYFANDNIREVESEENEKQNDIDEYPDSAKIDKIEYNAKYVKNVINFKNSPLKFVSSSSESVLKVFDTILLMLCLRISTLTVYFQ